LREQESQNSDHGEDDDTKPIESSNDVQSSVPVRTLSHQWLDNSRSCLVSESVISECSEAASSVENVDTTITSAMYTSQNEVTRLSCQSTESHDSFSHDSEHSSTTTQPSDEGVYSDDSVAASADELRPRHDQKTPTGRLTASAATAVSLGVSDKQDIFWTCPVNFCDFVNLEARDGTSRVADRYNIQTDMCYEDRMECELNGCIDMYRYFMLTFNVLYFIYVSHCSVHCCVLYLVHYMQSCNLCFH